MPDKCLSCRNNKDGTRNYRYGEDGTDLLFSIILNINPLDIVTPFNIKNAFLYTDRWNNFILDFIRPKIDIFDPKWNANDSDTELQSLIDEWNNKVPSSSNITKDVIKQAQEYHQIKDSNVVIDGRLGTQTFKLLYPTPIIWENKVDVFRDGKYVTLRNQTPDYGYLPVSWGDKKFVIKSSAFNQSIKNENIISPLQSPKITSTIDAIEIYKPSIHRDVLFYKEKDPNRTWSQWGILGLAYTPTPKPSPSEINLATKKDQFKKDVAQKTTDLLNQIK